MLIKKTSGSTALRLGAGFWISAMWIILVSACAATAPYLPLPEYDRMDWEKPAARPGSMAKTKASESPRRYVLGTDSMGRDMAARIVFGARVSLSVGLSAPVIGLVFGGLLGISAGYFRGRFESIVLFFIDVILAFPGLVLLLAVTFYFGPGIKNMIFTLGFLTIPAFARVARANTLACAERNFVLSARILGRTDLGILAYEIVPNIIFPIMTYALLVVSYMITAEGALSFLGLGVPAPVPSWGGMMAEGKEILEEAPHVCMLPALVMYLTVLSFNLMGDALRSLVDSREEQM